jgi:glycosyltransferase involved in cell wall biosynthesis
VYPGGEDEVVKAEKNMLEKFGHEVLLYETSNSKINERTLLGKLLFLFKEVCWSRESYDAVHQLIRREKPDIAHFHNTFFSITPSAYDACYNSGVPIVQTLHNYRFLCPIGVFYREGHLCEDCLQRGKISAVVNKCWRNSYIYSFILSKILRHIEKKKILSKKISSYIALSPFSRKKFIDYGFDQEKVFVKSNFIDFSLAFLPRNRTYGVFIGALRDYKGVRTLLRAWKDFKIDFLLKIIGVGPLQDELKAYAQGEKVEFLGAKSLAETLSFISASLFLVVPSECYETFSRVTMEAFACGVPVIATNHGVLKDLVEDEKTGLLFERSDSSDLAKKVGLLIKDPSLARALGENARKVYQEKYTESANYDQLIEIYLRTIKRHSQEKNFAASINQ